MTLSEQSILKIAEAVVDVLEKRGLVVGNVQSKPKINERSTYAKTEALLYNYVGFKKIIHDVEQEIEEIRVHGVPQKKNPFCDYVQTSNVPQIVTVDEAVDAAINVLITNVQQTVDAVQLIDKSMKTLEYDPYYKVLEMFYFEGRTQEDIAVEFGVSQVSISKNKSRLVRELSMRIFPGQTVEEMLS